MEEEITAAEYRAAARLADRAGLTVTAKTWRDEADRLDAAKEYAQQLAMAYDPRLEPFAAGTVIIRKLLDDGWTPPGGLL